MPAQPSGAGAVRTRVAQSGDAAAIAAIYNQGIEDRVATFETRPRSPEDIRAWFDGTHPIVVVEQGHRIIAFASTSTYRPRECYAGIAEFSVYVARDGRGRGAGRTAMEALIREAARAGIWKLVSRVFPENAASLRLLRSVGFREVGTYEKHARLDGVWRDVVIVERLIPANLTPQRRKARARVPRLARATEQPRRGRPRRGHSETDTASSVRRPRRRSSTSGRQQRNSTAMTANA